MKILILANNEVGLLKFRRELLIRLISLRHCVTVCLPIENSLQALQEIGCNVIDISFNRRGKNPIEEILLLNKYNRIINDVNPDIVLTYTVKPNIYGGLVCQQRKVPYISNVTGLGTSIENPGILSSLVLKLYNKGLCRSECVFFQNSSNMQMFLTQNVISKEQKARLIPGSGVNLTEHCYESYPSEQDNLIFLFIGRVMKDKGVEELFDAATKIKDEYPNIIFKIIGGCEENYQETLEKLTKEGVIEYLGYQEDIHSLIAQSHCTILPSYHEGTANVLLESAACGRPVIATKVPGCRETFDEGVSGLGCEVKDAKSLYLQIKHFIGLSHEKREKMGKAGRCKMENEYDRQIVIDAYIEEINEILSVKKEL